MTPPIRIGVLDDYQEVASAVADWSPLRDRADIVVLKDPIPPDEAAAALGDFDVLVAMRERMPFPASLLTRLPRLKMIALTGGRAPSLDLETCSARGIVVSNTGGSVAAATAELAWMLVLACSRHLSQAESNMRSGRWQDGVPAGDALEGKRLGVVGLGRLGSRVARYGAAFGMEVVAWSQNLTSEVAEAAGARRVEKAELFAASDVISLHLVLSDRTRGVVGEAELVAMRRGSILVNTSRGPLVDEAALLRTLREGRIVAGLDVFDAEPLPADHPLRTMPNTVLTPHLGYAVTQAYRHFYRESIENIAAFLDGKPIRVITPPMP